MRFVRKNNLVFLMFENLGRFPELAHGVFTRHGGNGSGPFSGLNVGRRVGDDEETVLRNRDAVFQCFGNGPLEYLHQIHGTDIVIFDGSGTSYDPPLQADGAVTAAPNRNLVIQVADCQPVMLYDPEHRAIANLHAGWRGSIGNIIAAGIENMKNRFGTDPRQLVAGIGPSLGPCCAEFINYKDEIPDTFWKYKDGQDRFNFWQISQDQLTVAGVPPENIEQAGICTKCNPHLLFSYRRSNTTGRFAAVIGLKG